jgi:hypothetical protein
VTADVAKWWEYSPTTQEVVGWIPHSANICVHKHVCLYWVWVFLCIVCICKKNAYKYVFIRYLAYLAHNTSLISAYFGPDSRECKCLEYVAPLIKKGCKSK